MFSKPNFEDCSIIKLLQLLDGKIPLEGLIEVSNSTKFDKYSIIWSLFISRDLYYTK